jgi:hypothetical protein
VCSSDLDVSDVRFLDGRSGSVSAPPPAVSDRASCHSHQAIHRRRGLSSPSTPGAAESSLSELKFIQIETVPTPQGKRAKHLGHFGS